MPQGNLVAASTSISNATDGQYNDNRQCFVMSDGQIVALFGPDGATALQYATSAAGTTWSAPGAAYGLGSSTAVNVTGATQNGNMIILWGNQTQSPQSGLFVAQLTYSTSTKALTAATYLIAYASNEQVEAGYDSANGVFHFVATAEGAGLQIGHWNTAAPYTGPLYGTIYNGTAPSVRGVKAYSSGGSTTILVLVQDSTGLFVVPVVYSGGTSGTYTAGSVETVTTQSVSGSACSLDSSNNLDIVYVTSNNLYALRRTGTKVYSSTVNLAGSAGSGVISLATNGNDLAVLYQSVANQANGEIYLVWRTSGVWGNPTRFAGGDSGGYSVPKATPAVVSGVLNAIYQASGGVYALATQASSAPNAPTVTAPSGSVAGLTPTITEVYSNTSAPTDTQSALEVKVTNGATTMWDSGKIPAINTTLGAATVADAASFTVAATTNIATGQQVHVGAGSAIETAQIGTISGTTCNLAASTVGTATLAAATSLPVAAGGGLSFFVGETIQVDSGTNLDTVTISAIATDTLTVSAMAHAHAAGVAVQGVLANAHASGDAVTAPGSSGSVVYGTFSNAADANYVRPATLAYGTQYSVQARTWDVISNTASAWSTAVTFTPYQAGTATITQIVDNGTTSTASPVTIASSTITSTTVSWSQPQSDAASQWQERIYANDGVTLLFSTAWTAFATNLASGSSTALPSWSPNLANSTTYQLAVALKDATSGVVVESAHWTLNTSWTPPPGVTGLVATPEPASGTVVLSWANPSGTASDIVQRAPTGTTNWTVLSTGSLITTLTDYPPMLTGFDYQVIAVTSAGIQAAAVTVTNVQLGANGPFGVWFHDSTQPGVSMCFGPIDTWQDASQFDSPSDVLAYVPLGGSTPIISARLQFYRTTTQRKFVVPDSALDAAGNAVSGKATIATMYAMQQAGNPILFRDVRGLSFYVRITNAHDEVFNWPLLLVQMDLTEVIGPLLPLTS